MKRILILILGLFGVAQAQFAPTSAKTAFKNGISLGTRDSTAYTANDSLVVVINRQGRMMYRSTDGYWKILANAAAADYVPYTGAVTNVNLGNFRLTARSLRTDSVYANGSGGLHLVSNSGTQVALLGAGGGAGTTFYGGIVGTTGSFASSGSGTTFAINHSSGSGIGLDITKGGNGEGLYINKTSGSGNAATIVGTLEATTLVKTGGTSSQFLKADGSVDSTAYGTGSVTSVATNTGSGITGGTITTSGTIAADTTVLATRAYAAGLDVAKANTSLNNVNGVLSSTYGGAGSVSGILKANGSGVVIAAVNNTDYTLLNGTGFVRMSGTTPSYVTGTSSQFVKADGSLDGTSYATAGSLSGYLPLSGGTLTGSLSGTSLSMSGATQLATSSGRVLVKTTTDNGTDALQVAGSGLFTGNLIVNGATNPYASLSVKANNTLTYGGLNIFANANDRFISLQHDGTRGIIEANNADSAIFTPIVFRTNNTDALTIATNQAATFASSISATAANFSGKITSTVGNNSTVLENTSATTGWVTMVRAVNTGGLMGLVLENSTGGNRAIGTSAYATVLSTYTNTPLQFGTDNNIRLTISGTGSATFSSSVTATGLTINKSNGNSQIYFQNNGSLDWDLGTQVGDATQNFSLYNRGTSSIAFSLNKSTNAATFSSSVTATEGLFGGAVTNGTDKLRVSGNTSTSQLITGSFNPNMILRNTATTLSSLYTTVIANGGSNYTYTLDAASGHNRIYIIRAYGSGTSITLNRSGSDVIVDNAGNNQTSLTITPSGGAVWVQSNGSNAYIQLK